MREMEGWREEERHGKRGEMGKSNWRRNESTRERERERERKKERWRQKMGMCE